MSLYMDPIDRILATGLLLGLAGAATARQPCEQAWGTAHRNPEVLHQSQSGLYCIETFTFDGQIRLYQSGGHWEDAGGVMSWEDGRWRDIVERGIDEPMVRCWDLAQFDDGAGSTLYGAKSDGGLIALRDGAWTVAVPAYADALAVWESGPLPGLYFGGYFRQIEGAEALYIGRWDGKAWSPVGGGMGFVEGPVSPGVMSLRVWDDGSGPALYAGGRFDTAGGTPAVSIARWDGVQWSALGDPIGEHLIDNTQPRVFCFTDYDDGSGPALYAGGNFQGTPGIASSSVMKWDGQQWHGLDGGLKTSILNQSGDAFVYALEWHDDGDGMKLYAGGHMTRTGAGTPVNFIARWDGSTWEPVLGGMRGPVRALKSFDDGRGPTLWVGAESEYADGEGVWDGQWITDAGWKQTGAVARYDKNGWHRPNTGGMEGIVNALLVRKEAGRQVVYAGGEFFAAGDGRRLGLARFDGTTWSDVGDWQDLGNVKERVYDSGIKALAALPGDDGIYAAVSLPIIDRPWTSGVARFDGQHWTWVGGEFFSSVHTLSVHDLGNGPRLCAGTMRRNDSPGGVQCFEGQAWTSIGEVKGSNEVVATLKTLDVPGLPGQKTLYAIGDFKEMSGVPAGDIARWDGQAWSAVGEAEFTWPDATPGVYAIAGFDAGDGYKVYVGGNFRFMNGQPCTLAAWNGEAWEAVSHDPGRFFFADVLDAGGGPALYLGGIFESVAGVPASGLIRLTADGQWENVDPAGEGFRFGYFQGEGSGNVKDVVLFDDPVAGPSLMGAGQFETAGGVSSGNVAQLFLCPPPCVVDCDGSGSLDALDFLCFSTLFAGADPGADLDGNGELDLFDFLWFVNAFNQGC